MAVGGKGVVGFHVSSKLVQALDWLPWESLATGMVGLPFHSNLAANSVV